MADLGARGSREGETLGEGPTAARRAPRTAEDVAARVADFDDDHEPADGVLSLNADFFFMQRLRASEGQ